MDCCEVHAEQARMTSDEAAKSSCTDSNYLHLLPVEAAPGDGFQPAVVYDGDVVEAITNNEYS